MVRSSTDSIYLDHAATTPVRREVIEAMMPCLGNTFGNPSSRHDFGRQARDLLRDARVRAAETLGTTPDSVFFVRGGTESDNLAILGRARADRDQGKEALVVTSAVEHPAVYEAGEQIVREGGTHLVIEVSDGGFDMDGLRTALNRRPSVVSCMWVNNEIGIRLPVEDIAVECRNAGVPFHSDAVQAVGKIPVRLDEVPIDLLTVTGHKIYGPKGTGVLCAANPQALLPLQFGGGQEGDVRPGTEDVAGAVGFARALELAVDDQPEEAKRLLEIRDSIERRLLSAVPDARINGGHLPRAPHIASLGLLGVDLDALLAALDMAGLAVSGGSACASGSGKPSPTLTALYGSDDARPSIRVSLGRLVGEDDTDRIVTGLTMAIGRTQELFA